MFENVTKAYDLSDATIEILTMVIVAWILWFILGWLLKRCKHTGHVVAAHKPKKVDNLKVVEWIGPKIEKLLNKADIHSFKDLANAHHKDLKAILDDAGSMFQMHNPKTWPDQAKLADAGHWGELKEYQDLLSAGRDS